MIVVRYDKARRAIRAALTAGGSVPDALADAVRRIEIRPARSEFDESENRLSIAAIRQFSAVYGRIASLGVAASAPGVTGFPLRIEGVGISLSPAVMLERSRRGERQVGALILNLQKGWKVGERGGKAVTELLRQGLVGAGVTGVRPELCLFADVFAGQVFAGTGRSQAIDREITAACREIAARWPLLVSVA
jgi:hypothetical protein